MTYERPTAMDPSPTRLFPFQVRGARGLLGWSMPDLARAAGVSVSAVMRIEAADSRPISDELHGAVRAAFEAAGVRFLEDDGAGPGMRVRPT